MIFLTSNCMYQYTGTVKYSVTEAGMVVYRMPWSCACNESLRISPLSVVFCFLKCYNVGSSANRAVKDLISYHIMYVYTHTHTHV